MKNLGDYLDYVRERSHQFKISINTNGSQLNDEKIELITSHKVDLLNICIDGATKETAKAVRLGLKFDKIESNVHRLLNFRRKSGRKYPQVRVAMVLIDQNRHEAEMFLKRWRGVADYVGLSGFSNRAGSLSDSSVPVSAGTGTTSCVYPFSTLNIWADGKAVLCCNDWNEEYVVGDLNRQTLHEVWHGPEVTNARRLHIQKRGAELASVRDATSGWRDLA